MTLVSQFFAPVLSAKYYSKGNNCEVIFVADEKVRDTSELFSDLQVKLKMLEITYSSQFKKDFEKVRKLPLPDLKIIFEVISNLEQEVNLDAKYKDHELFGN